MAWRDRGGSALRKDHTKTPETIEKILQSVLKRHGLDQEILRYRFVLYWKEIVGEEIAKRAHPECIKNGCLVVRVKDSAWAQELSFQKQVILSRLKKHLAEKDRASLHDVIFYVTGESIPQR